MLRRRTNKYADASMRKKFTTQTTMLISRTCNKFAVTIELFLFVARDLILPVYIYIDIKLVSERRNLLNFLRVITVFIRHFAKLRELT